MSFINKRFIGKICWFMLLLSMLWGVWKLLSNRYYFPVRKVQIYASYYFLDESQIKPLLMPVMQANFFSLDLNRVKHRLLHLPSVANVVVSRLWPATISIHIEEHRPVAHWLDKQFIGADGAIFAPQTSLSLSNKGAISLPYLHGPPHTAHRVLQEYKNLSTILKTLALRIVCLSLKSDGEWSLQLNNGMIVVLGKAPPTQKIVQFVRVYPQAFGSRGDKVAQVDLRYPSGMAVKWRTKKIV